MSKIAVVYWSGTGNTEEMAKAVLRGINQSGGKGTLYTSAEFSDGMMDAFDAFAFGCPAMGAEVLEETEFEPMFEACKKKLNGKKAAIFGSYGWGDGEWMRNWEENCKNVGAELVRDGLMCNEAPDQEVLGECEKLGAALV